MLSSILLSSILLHLINIDLLHDNPNNIFHHLYNLIDIFQKKDNLSLQKDENNDMKNLIFTKSY